MKKILVTGGCGYIGAHTIVDLLQSGFDVISVDNLSRGSLRMLSGIEKITGRQVKNYKVDLCHLEDTEAVFIENPDIVGIIHFAAYKLVGESVQDPLKYFSNNLNSLINILKCAAEYEVPHIVFSSSCSVYGNAEVLPVSEHTPLQPPQSPYARTKQMGEEICRDFISRHKGYHVSLLRYFNPVGAHPSAAIGELQEKPENLVPMITQTAIGRRAEMTVYGTDYPTRDGSCIRDYIHVMDIAHAHTLSLQLMLAGKQARACEVFNLGSGNGVSVLELIQAFEKVSGQKLNYKPGPRRDGDVVAIYADNSKAKSGLGWDCRYDTDQMMDTAWRWELTMRQEASAHLN